MKYRRILDKGDDEIIILTEDGGIATIRQTDEIEDGDGRRSTIEWYDTSIQEILASKLPAVLSSPLEDLPKYLNCSGDMVQDILKSRFAGEPQDCLFFWVFDWLSNNSKIYYEDSALKFEDDSLIDICIRELIGDSRAEHERDDSLFKEYFE